MLNPQTPNDQQIPNGQVPMPKKRSIPWPLRLGHLLGIGLWSLVIHPT